MTLTIATNGPSHSWVGSWGLGLLVMLLAFWGLLVLLGVPLRKFPRRVLGALLLIVASSLYVGMYPAWDIDGGWISRQATQGLLGFSSTLLVLLIKVLLLAASFAALLIATDWLPLKLFVAEAGSLDEDEPWSDGAAAAMVTTAGPRLRRPRIVGPPPEWAPTGENLPDSAGARIAAPDDSTALAEVLVEPVEPVVGVVGPTTRRYDPADAGEEIAEAGARGEYDHGGRVGREERQDQEVEGDPGSGGEYAHESEYEGGSAVPALTEVEGSMGNEALAAVEVRDEVEVGAAEVIAGGEEGEGDEDEDEVDQVDEGQVKYANLEQDEAGARAATAVLEPVPSVNAGPLAGRALTLRGPLGLGLALQREPLAAPVAAASAAQPAVEPAVKATDEARDETDWNRFRSRSEDVMPLAQEHVLHAGTYPVETGADLPVAAAEPEEDEDWEEDDEEEWDDDEEEDEVESGEGEDDDDWEEEEDDEEEEEEEEAEDDEEDEDDYYEDDDVEEEEELNYQAASTRPAAEILGALDEDERGRFQSAIRVLLQNETISLSRLQRELGVTYYAAAQVFERLEKAGLIAPYSGTLSREIRLDRDEWARQVDSGS